MSASLTIDELVVLINAETKDFKRQIAEISDQLEGIDKTAGKMSKSTAAAFGVIAGAAQALVNKGINLITNSIGNAVKRVDTLNNSNKVFQNLGFSAADTKKQMDFLLKSILGLPTSLDDAVSGVEALASVSGNLEDSTKTYKALNDGILGMGGSADMVRGAILQLSQLPMDGPLDAQTWNSLRQNGLTPVISAMAKDMGLSIGQLKDDFGSGKLTVQDFTNELQKLDIEGGAGMASLEKQARDATHGIGTGWTNMQTAITRGVADIMKAIGTSNISGVLANIGKSFEEGLSGVGDGITRVKDYLSALTKMNPNEAAKSIGTELGKALRMAFDSIKIGTDTLKKWFGSIDWFAVGKNIVTQLIPGLVGGILAGLGSNDLWVNIWRVISKHWGEILLGVLTIALAPAKLLGPLTKIIGKIPLIGPLINFFVKGIRSLFAPIRDSFTWLFGSAIGGPVMGFIGALKAIFGTIGEILLAPFRIFIDAIAFEIRLIPTFFSDMFGLVKTIFGVALDILKTIFVTTFKFVFDTIKTIFEPFLAFFKGLWDGLSGQLSGVPGMFTGFFRGAWDGVKGIWSAATGWFAGVWNGIRGVFGDVGGWFGSVFSAAYNAVVGVFSRLGGFFSGVWSNIVNIFSGAGTSVGNAIGGAFRSVINGVLSGAGNILNGFISTINALKNKIPVIGSKIPSIPHLSIPYLAAGGIVTAPTLSMIGEGGQPEAVIPLDKLEKMMGGSRIPVNVQIDGQTLLSFVIDGINNKAFMTNGSVLDL